MASIFCDRCGDTVAEGCDPLDELAQLELLLERLTQKRYDLKRKINRLHSPIVRQLPPDVTSTIFEFCLPLFTNLRYLPFEMNFPFPLSLGAICSYWRDIAWSTPSLWSSLMVYVSGNDSHTTIVKQWLARSGQLPLSISIYSVSNWRQVLAVANIINQYSSRWFELDLVLPLSFYQYFHATDNHAPILKFLRFHGADQYRSREGVFHLSCPRLEKADFTSFQMNGMYIQCDNVTHLDLYDMSTIDSLLILRMTPRLVFCSISFFAKQSRARTGAILTSLKFLQLHTSSFHDFLNNLITPGLEELRVSRCDKASIESIASLLKRSTCSLRSFSITCDLSIHLEEFTSLLQLMPSLKTLSLRSADEESHQHDLRSIMQLVDKVLSSQSATLQRGLLPNLEVLEYTGQLCLGLCPENLHPLPPTDNIVHDGPLHLLKLSLHSKPRIPKTFISCFLSLAARGVTVNVLSRSEDILQSSMDYYKAKEESLGQDWVDNLDLSLMQDSS